MGPKTLCKLHQRYNLDNTYSLEINNNYDQLAGAWFKFDQNIDRVKIYEKIDKPPFSTLPLPVGSPQKFDYSHNYTIFDPVQLFPQDIWRVQIWPQHRQGWAISNKIHNLFSICSSHPWVTLKNLTIHTISQSLTLSNFFYKTPVKFKIGHNIGKVEIYDNKFSTLTPFLLPTPGWPLKIWLVTQWHNLSPCLTFSTRHLASSNLATT